MKTTAFCIEAQAGQALFSGEPGVWYKVWRGRRPPTVLARIFCTQRPMFQSQDIDKARAFIADYHQSEALAQRFNDEH